MNYPVKYNSQFSLDGYCAGYTEKWKKRRRVTSFLFDKKLLIIIAQGEKAEGLSTHPFDNICTERESGFPHSRTADIKV